MNAKDAIQTSLHATKGMLSMYLADFSDADLLVRPVPGANHTAWQLGHLIAAEVQLVGKNVPRATYPELPKGFAEQHDKKTATIDTPTAFLGKSAYLNLFGMVRESTLANTARLTDSDFDIPVTGDMAKYAPTLGALLLLVSNHTLMHAGQFTVVRRKLGKPILF